MHDDDRIHDNSHLTLSRIETLRDNLIDLSVAIDDLDAELAPGLAERARLAGLLRSAQIELATLLRRAA